MKVKVHVRACVITVTTTLVSAAPIRFSQLLDSLQAVREGKLIKPEPEYNNVPGVFDESGWDEDAIYQ